MNLETNDVDFSLFPNLSRPEPNGGTTSQSLLYDGLNERPNEVPDRSSQKLSSAELEFATTRQRNVHQASNQKANEHVEDQVNDMRCNRRSFRSGTRANSEMSMDKGSLAELFLLMEKGKSSRLDT